MCRMTGNCTVSFFIMDLISMTGRYVFTGMASFHAPASFIVKIPRGAS